MHDYEIRILNAAGRLTLLSRTGLSGDLAAMRAGRELCRDGESMEIWRGDVCVFSQDGGHDGLPPRHAAPRPPRARLHIRS